MVFTLKEDYSKISVNFRKKLNKIANKYNGWHTPNEIRTLWDDLANEGVEVLIMGYPDKSENGTKYWTVPFTYNGDTVENSRFVFDVYEGFNSLKNEYNMYFS